MCTVLLCKQKTEYEWRISDRSANGGAADLQPHPHRRGVASSRRSSRPHRHSALEHKRRGDGATRLCKRMACPFRDRSSSARGNRLTMASVTIGVPVYNGAATLRECLECLRNQTFRDIEVLISDNASSDNIAAIAQEFRSE